jgi:glycosyltransferase involved in cell wall biosynthesis
MKVFYIDPTSYAVLGKYDLNLLREITNFSPDINIEFIAHKNILKEEYMSYGRGYSVKIFFNYQRLSPAWQKALSYIFSYGKIFALLIKSWPDLIHIQWTKLPLFDIFAINFFTLLKIPVIYTHHDDLPHNLNLFKVFLYKLIYRSVTRIIVHSKSTKDSLVNHFGSNLNEICIVIPYGRLDSNSKNLKALCNREEAENSEHFPLRFSMLGYILPYKGIIEYLEIWSYAFHNHSDLLSKVQLRIIGRADRDYFAKVSDFIHKNGITNVFIDDRWLSDQEFEEEMYSSDVCVLPYLCMSQSGVLMTLLSQRKPCIVSNVGGLTDPFDIAKVGWIFSWEENIRLTVEKAVLRPILDIESGWHPSSKDWQAIDQYFSWSRAGEATASLYGELSA